MKILINGANRELPEGITISQMIEHLSLPPRRMAIEVNKQVIRKQDWESTKLDERDAIEIVHFVGGG
jgi:sulfur carrier protein